MRIIKNGNNENGKTQREIKHDLFLGLFFDRKVRAKNLLDLYHCINSYTTVMLKIELLSHHLMWREGKKDRIRLEESNPEFTDIDY